MAQWTTILVRPRRWRDRGVVYLGLLSSDSSSSVLGGGGRPSPSPSNPPRVIKG